MLCHVSNTVSLGYLIGIPSMAGGFSFGQVDSTQAMLCLPMANQKEEILSKKDWELVGMALG